jgi:hypothetical protein
MKEDKVIKYEFKSLPGRYIFIPEENAKKAEDLVKAIVNAETSGELFFNAIYSELRMNGSPYPEDKDLLPRAIDLMFSERGGSESLRLEDNVYVRAFRCLYMKDKEAKSSKGKTGILNITDHFIEILEFKD